MGNKQHKNLRSNNKSTWMKHDSFIAFFIHFFTAAAAAAVVFSTLFCFMPFVRFSNIKFLFSKAFCFVHCSFFLFCSLILMALSNKFVLLYVSLLLIFHDVWILFVFLCVTWVRYLESHWNFVQIMNMKNMFFVPANCWLGKKWTVPLVSLKIILNKRICSI